MAKNDDLLPFQTSSLCPECKEIIRAEVFEEKGRVLIKKKCPSHGEFADVYWSDAELFKRAAKFSFEASISDHYFITEKPKCPFSCGLCSIHQGHTALLNIVITNRCNLACWYCFFYAQRSGFIYEPDLKTLREMIRKAKIQNQPIGIKAVQLTGGEPTLRDDLFEIIKMIKKEGITHIQVNTNGLILAEDKRLASKLKRAGVNVVYLSFDGLDEKTNPKNCREIPLILEHCRRANLGIVLVPTVIKSINDHQVGDIIKFAFENIDIVRGVNFQPVSLVGSMPKNKRERYRVTIPDVIIEIEKQLKGAISRNDFYPVPSVAPISSLIKILTGNPQLTLSTHFACGMATYIFNDNGKIVPVTKLIDIDKFFQLIKKKIDELKYSRIKKIKLLEGTLGLRKIIKKRKISPDLKIDQILFDIFVKHNYKSLGEFHKNSLFIGLMHFQDLYNYDIERVKRCQIHYCSPDGRLIPFCSFNVLPEIYRDKIQEGYSLSIEEWEEKSKRKLKDDLKRQK